MSAFSDIDALREEWRADSTVLRSGCKLNLFLNICARRPDGYHELQTLFYPLPEPFDELFVRLTPEPGLKLFCPQMPELEQQNTTLHKAMNAFNQAAKVNLGCELLLNKRVPAGAGLGGGSANAAALLCFLNRQMKEHALRPEAMLTAAARVGADVPFFLLNSPAAATGVGERLIPAAVSLAGYYLLLALPGLHVSTPWAYAEWDRLHDEGRLPQSVLPDLFRQWLDAGAKTALSPWPWFYNNLENAVFPACPEIGRIKEKLLEAGAGAALMSGSGSSVFALFRRREAAEAAAQKFTNFRTLILAL
ncbi:MAG: 4-(cytidine 5'-diphospho)-2-C-methyl-D-erythritol kinase [Desulfovibrionaceae bacterium]|nr:4-(cytidine 5'-diphospho)-2-C-methyl-D-erythritol kinase [Desulfovibrionaceae bacterium]